MRHPAATKFHAQARCELNFINKMACLWTGSLIYRDFGTWFVEL